MKNKSAYGNISLAVLLLIASITFTAYNLNLSQKIGRLSTVTTYDDIVYINNAADIYFTATQEGITQAIKSIFTKNLHSPFSTLTALSGYCLFGFDPETVYYAQVLVLIAYLVSVVWFTRKLRFEFRITILLSSLAIPYASLCVLVFRPDQMSGIVVAACAVAILTSENLFNKKRNAVLIGVGFGFALLIKSSTFALIILVICGSWIITAYRYYYLKKSSIYDISISGLITVLAALALSGWYWGQHAREMWAYFIDNSFGKNSDIWKTPGGISEHLLYYFRGATYYSGLGLFMIPLAAILSFGCVKDIVYSNKLEEKMIAVGTLWILTCIYIIFSLQQMKNQYMGGVLYMFILFAALVYFEKITNSLLRLDRIKSILISTVVVLISIMLYRYPPTEKANQVWAKNAKLTTQGIISDLKTKNKTSIIFTQGGPVVPEYISMIRKANLQQTVVGCAVFTKNLDDVISMIQKFEYIVLQDKEIEGRPGYPMPAEEWEPRLKSYLDNNQKWFLVNEYNTLDGKKVYLYSRN
jgi:energy-converting hydrogenase Eha subunit F